MPGRKKSRKEPVVIIHDDEIKSSIEEFVIGQRQAYQEAMPGASDSDDAEAVSEEIGVNTWLDAEHVDATIRNLVGARAHLRDTVGVLPVFNKEYVQARAQSVAYNKIIVDPRFKNLLPSKKPLPGRSTLKGRALVARDKEEQKRNQQERALQEKADLMLEKNNFTEDKMLLLFLQSMVESDHPFLNNPQNEDLTLDECTQLIIPFRQNGCHYTVAVINFTQVDDNNVAEIKYYDSMGSDLDDSEIEQLTSFCTELGYEVNYEALSSPIQREGWNCGIFASFKAIDIANENEENDERLLDGLDDENYHRHFNYYRFLISMMLSDRGYNVSVTDELAFDIKVQQTEFRKLSKKSKNSEDVNRCLTETAKLFEDMLKQTNERKSKNKKTKGRQPVEPLANANSKLLFKRCIGLRGQMEKLLQKKLALKKPNKKDQAQIRLLLELISAFDAAKDDLKGKIDKQNRVKKRVRPENWLENVNWKKALFYGIIAVCAITFVAPYLLAALTGAGVVLPANPLITILGGGTLFGVGILLVNHFNKNAGSKVISNKLHDDRVSSVEFTDWMRHSVTKVNEAYLPIISLDKVTNVAQNFMPVKKAAKKPSLNESTIPVPERQIKASLR